MSTASGAASVTFCFSSIAKIDVALWNTFSANDGGAATLIIDPLVVAIDAPATSGNDATTTNAAVTAASVCPVFLNMPKPPAQTPARATRRRRTLGLRRAPRNGYRYSRKA